MFTSLSEKLPKLGILTLATVASTLLLWLPFFLNLETFWTIPLPPGGMATIVSNFDGPYYLAIAKSFYQPELIKQFEFPLPVEYYAAHYPLYPLTIRLLSLVTNYPYAMLASTLIFSVLATFTFYLLASTHHPQQTSNKPTPNSTQAPKPSSSSLASQPFLLALTFLVIPARWFVLRSIGSPEPLFIFLILLSLLGMTQKNYWIAGIAGALAQLTKPPAILLFFAYASYLLWPLLKNLPITGILPRVHPNKKTPLPKTSAPSFPWHAYPLLLIPLSLLSLWFFYSQIFGSLLAYFQSGDNIHLFWPPFQVFNRQAPWIGTFWLEDIIWIYLLVGVGLVYLIKKGLPLFAWLAGIWLFSIFFVSHRDIARYSTPIFPLILIAASSLLETKEFKILLGILLIPIYLYSVNFIASNTIAISDWTPLL